MELMAEVWAWFTAEGRWSWSPGGGIPFRTVQHLTYTVVTMLIAVAVAIPPALYLAHHRKGQVLASAVVNLGRAIPSFGLIILFWFLATLVPGVGTQFWPLILALVALALPPIFTNTYAAIRGVDAATVEAARGVGLDEWQVLRQVELPLAAPIMAAGVRVATVQVVATAAIGAIVTNGGGLGRYIVDGFAMGAAGYDRVVGGAILVALLTIAIDQLMALGERAVRPAGPARAPDVPVQVGAAG